MRSKTLAGWPMAGARVSQIQGFSAMSKDAQAAPTNDMVISTIAPLPIPSRARVAKSVDARDLKSLGRNWPCRFESGSGHHTHSPAAQSRKSREALTSLSMSRVILLYATYA